MWYDDFSLFVSLVYKNKGGFTPAEGLFTAKSVRLLWWSHIQHHQPQNLVRRISRACRGRLFHRLCSQAKQGPCVDPETDSGPGQVWMQVCDEQMNVCPVSFSVKNRRGVEVAPLNNSHSLGLPLAAAVMTPCVGAVTTSCLSGAGDGVEQRWRRWDSAGGWCWRWLICCCLSKGHQCCP